MTKMNLVLVAFYEVSLDLNLKKKNWIVLYVIMLFYVSGTTRIIMH